MLCCGHYTCIHKPTKHAMLLLCPTGSFAKFWAKVVGGLFAKFWFILGKVNENNNPPAFFCLVLGLNTEIPQP
jgi:hypothetical protein